MIGSQEISVIESVTSDESRAFVRREDAANFIDEIDLTKAVIHSNIRTITSLSGFSPDEGFRSSINADEYDAFWSVPPHACIGYMSNPLNEERRAQFNGFINHIRSRNENLENNQAVNTKEILFPEKPSEPQRWPLYLGPSPRLGWSE